MNETNRIKKVLFLIVAMFIFLVLYLAYFQIGKSQSIAAHPNNPRNWVDEHEFKRGSIYDRNGNVLAESVLQESGEFERTYPEGPLFAHIIGYSSVDYGKTGLEEEFNEELLNVAKDTPISDIKNMIIENDQGKDLVLTLDESLQRRAAELLEGHKGSVIVTDVKTGDIYAMVSMPSFDPNYLTRDWDYLVNDENSALLNRSTQGLYTPGSIIKVITSVDLMENLNDFSYYDNGYTVVDGYRINNYNDNAYGEIGLETALVVSSNTYFVDKGLEIDISDTEEVFKRFLFNKNLDFELPCEVPVEPFEEGMDINEYAAALYGQGKTLVTPLQMALTISAISNEGQMVRPRIVKEIINPNNEEREAYNEDIKIISQVTDKQTANELRGYLGTVVDNYATATTYQTSSGGKTGTAETGSGLSHAWYLGFAPLDEPRFAVSVILEEDGTLGGETAAPIGARMLDYAVEYIGL